MPARTCLAVAMLAHLAVPAAAAPVTGEGLRKLVAGRTVHLSTPYGIELPLRYQRDGRVSGDISGFRLARLFAPRETGRWWVDNDRLCQQWQSWYEGKTFCFTIRTAGEGRIRWIRDDGYSGSARIEG
jgi:hypothetical protein